MSVLFSCEIDISQVNQHYYCTDQTNTLQRLETRNFYDSAQIDLFATGTDIVFGSSLYSSVDCQASVDFSVVIQNVLATMSVNYEGLVGTFAVNYVVVDSEYIQTPIISLITTASGVFIDWVGKKVLITQSPFNPDRVLFEILE